MHIFLPSVPSQQSDPYPTYCLPRLTPYPATARTPCMPFAAVWGIPPLIPPLPRQAGPLAAIGGGGGMLRR